MGEAKVCGNGVTVIEGNKRETGRKMVRIVDSKVRGEAKRGRNKVRLMSG